jgi:hypothetical protein
MGPPYSGMMDISGDMQDLAMWGAGAEERTIARRVLEGRVHSLAQENDSLRAIINMLMQDRVDWMRKNEAAQSEMLHYRMLCSRLDAQLQEKGTRIDRPHFTGGLFDTTPGPGESDPDMSVYFQQQDWKGDLRQSATSMEGSGGEAYLSGSHQMLHQDWKGAVRQNVCMDSRNVCMENSTSGLGDDVLLNDSNSPNSLIAEQNSHRDVSASQSLSSMCMENSAGNNAGNNGAADTLLASIGDVTPQGSSQASPNTLANVDVLSGGNDGGIFVGQDQNNVSGQILSRQMDLVERAAKERHVGKQTFMDDMSVLPPPPEVTDFNQDP